MRPGERIPEGLDSVVGRGVVEVPAVIGHGKSRDPADRDAGKAHHGVAIRIDALQAERVDHGIAGQRVELAFGFTLLDLDRRAAEADLVGEAGGERRDGGHHPSAIAHGLCSVQLFADAAGCDGRGLVLHPTEIHLRVGRDSLVDAAERPVPFISIGTVGMIPGVILSEGVGCTRIGCRIVVSQIVRRNQRHAAGGDYIVGKRRAGPGIPNDYHLSIRSGLGTQKLAEIERAHLSGGNVGVEGLAIRRLLIHGAGIEVSPLGNQRTAELPLHFTELVTGFLGIEVRLRVECRGAALVIDLPVQAVAAVLGNQVHMDRLGGVHTRIGDGHLGGVDEGRVTGLRRAVLGNAIERPGLLISG